MKKILLFLFLGAVGFTAYSCDNDDDVVVQGQDYDTFPVMTDATGTFTSADNFTLSMDIKISNTDVVLVYRKVGNVWQIIPKTYYLDDVTGYPTGRELDYNFDFNTQEVNIRTEANFNQATQMTPAEANQYLANQTFRIVLVPADPAGGKTGKGSAVDYSDYNAVVKYYNLDETKVQTFKVN